MVPFQIDRKPFDARDENSDAPEPCHVGADVNRIDALAADVNVERLRQIFAVFTGF